MKQSFEQWRESLDAKPGDVIIADNAQQWILLGAGWFFVDGVELDNYRQAAFYRACASGLTNNPDPRFPCRSANYDFISTWRAEEESEVEKYLNSEQEQFGVGMRERYRALAAAIKADICNAINPRLDGIIKELKSE